MPFIDDLIDFAAQPADQLTDTVVRLAELSLLDWIVCGRAGVDEPVAQKLNQFVAQEGGMEIASTFVGSKVPARAAALVNGAISHALDYDDTHFAHVGHLSVGILPACLAVAEETDASSEAMISAFVIGAEAAIRIGLLLGKTHYNQGFHQTATAGAFGATVAAGRLLGLSGKEMRAALGLCATRASGLKSQFGTMGKPLNAGFAASNGVECAQLAALGMTSCDDGLMGPQGFVETHYSEFLRTNANWDDFSDGQLLWEDNKYKLHACCHGLHAMIEALLLARSDGISLADVESFSLKTNPRWLKVCDIKRPRTGLEIKFSYSWLAGMTLRGDGTGAPDVYTDDLARDVELTDFAGRVTVIGDEALTDLQADGVITLTSGESRTVSFDLAAPLPLETLETKLQIKAEACLGAEGQQIWALRDSVGKMTARDVGAMVAG